MAKRFMTKSCIATRVAKKAWTMSMRKREGDDGPGSITAFDNPVYGNGDGDFRGDPDEYMEVTVDDE